MYTRLSKDTLDLPLLAKVRTPVGEGYILGFSNIDINSCRNYSVWLIEPHDGERMWHAATMDLEKQIELIDLAPEDHPFGKIIRDIR
jgi:hypothetical protein